MDAAQRETLIANFSAEAAPDEEAIRAAAAMASELAPAILARLEAAAGGAFPLPEDARLIENGLHVLAAARWIDAMPAFLRFLTQAAPAASYALGWDFGERAATLATALFDGDAEALLAAVAHPEIGEMGCWALMRAAVELARGERLPRQKAVSMLERFDEERLHPDDSMAWEGWRVAAIALGEASLGKRVLASLEDGRAPDREADLLDWRERGERLKHGTLRPDDIDEAPPSIEEMLAGEAEDETDDTGGPAPRVDPGGDAALTEADFLWLDGFLAAVPPGYAHATVGWIDGFITALAAGPMTVPDEAAVEGILDNPDMPWPDSLAPARAHAGALLRRHYKAIDRRLAADRGLVPLTEPGDERPFQSWSEGFMHLVDIAEADRRPVTQHPQRRALLNPIVFAATGRSDHNRSAPPTDADEIAAEIADGMYALREQFGGKTRDPRTVAPRTGPKIGRNDPCPCGSGKKYKKCCGKAA